ncbi:MAG: OsmC family protein [Deltaproteobacteria bacterium]|nr:OsmC family protein [Deltaproteobacteria bacterium]
MGFVLDPARILAAAVGDCLSASLLFCMKKNGADTSALTSDVKVELVRNDNNGLRIGNVSVTLHPTVAASDAALQKCMRAFARGSM